MENEELHIIDLVLKYWSGTLAREEKQEFEDLLQNPVWECLKNLDNDENLIRHFREYNKYNTSQEFALFLQQIKREPQKRGKRHLLPWFLGVATACLLLVFGMNYLMDFSGYENERAVDKPVLNYPKGSPDDVRLVLGNDSVIALTNQTDLKQFKLEGVSMKGIRSLDYSRVVSRTAEDTLNYNTLIVPRGRIFEMILADSSRVVLNSETKLKYPVCFGESIRDVYVEGEAYFEVKRDPQRPFIVSGKNFEVEVLGTSFNVMNYGNEFVSRVTLLSGSINMITEDSCVRLNPGQQAIMRVNSTIEIRDVDVESIVYWLNYRLNFNEEELGVIMRELGRWYGVEVVYEDPSLKKVLYSGTIPYNITLTELLELLNYTTDIKFKLNDGIVLIRRD